MTKNQIERLILNERKIKLKEREREFYEKIAALRKNNPKFAEVDYNLRSKTMRMLNGEENLKSEVEKLEKEYNSSLKKAGIVKATIACKRCADAGVVGSKLCECIEKEVFDKLVAMSGATGLPVRKFADSDFKIFKNPNEAKAIYKFFEGEVKRFRQQKTLNYVICGNPGGGKTFLFEVIAGELMRMGVSVFFTTAFNLNDLFLKYHTTFGAERLSFLAPVLEAEALIVDDLGTEQILNNVTGDLLLHVLKERIAAGKKTFINTNLMPDQLLDKYSERIYSRLADKSNSRFIAFNNSNLRIN